VNTLRTLQPILAQLGRVQLRDKLDAVTLQLRACPAPLSPAEVVDSVIAVCRSLYGQSRSAEGLGLARAAQRLAVGTGEPLLMRRTATVCGLLCADSADLVGAIEHHVFSLRLAIAAGDSLAQSQVWNNIGLAMGIAAHYELAARCYRRALALVENHEGPVFSRYTACANLSDSLLQTGAVEEGLPMARKAMREQTPQFREQDLHGALLLQRNLVRLLVVAGRPADAKPFVKECTALAERTGTSRSIIAAATAQATWEIAMGRTEVALTRLDDALSRARRVPAALRDTLACVIRAEECAGNVERALARLDELSEHIYRSAIDRAREHIELASLGDRARTRLEHDEDQARARLASQLEPAAAPEEWSALERLGVSAAMRIDPTGWHGKRVGALVKALAMAHGSDPLQALEMGLAAELHDIGMMSVPEGILRKPGPLNDAERAIVRRHTDAGAEMLRDDRHPRVFMAREISTYHHCRWDGDGYPEGVAGRRIPVGARICAVADAYDAMVCGLGSHAPRSMESALHELRREAGGQFDPELVASFDEVIHAETHDLGLDLAASAGTECFQALVASLSQDRGFV
jgi:HD-GYP domain-containing protein (c-di-GMP phosphodiesterase class II)